MDEADEALVKLLKGELEKRKRLTFVEQLVMDGYLEAKESQRLFEWTRWAFERAAGRVAAKKDLARIDQLDLTQTLQTQWTKEVEDGDSA